MSIPGIGGPSPYNNIPKTGGNSGPNDDDFTGDYNQFVEDSGKEYQQGVQTAIDEQKQEGQKAVHEKLTFWELQAGAEPQPGINGFPAETLRETFDSILMDPAVPLLDKLEILFEKSDGMDFYKAITDDQVQALYDFVMDDNIIPLEKKLDLLGKSKIDFSKIDPIFARSIDNFKNSQKESQGHGSGGGVTGTAQTPSSNATASTNGSANRAVASEHTYIFIGSGGGGTAKHGVAGIDSMDWYNGGEILDDKA